MVRLFLFLIALGVASSAQAATAWDTLPSLGHVSDYAQVLQEKERFTLEGLFQELQTQYGVNLGLLTVKNLERYKINEMAKYLYERWEMGRPSANQAALALLETDNGQLHLYVGMGLRGVLTKGWTEELSEALAPMMESKDFRQVSIALSTSLVRRVYEQSKNLPRRSPRILEAGGVFSFLPKNSSGMVAGIGGLFAALLLGSSLMKAKQQALLTSAVVTGRDFGRDRLGAFGNKKPRQL